MPGGSLIRTPLIGGLGEVQRAVAELQERANIVADSRQGIALRLCIGAEGRAALEAAIDGGCVGPAGLTWTTVLRLDTSSADVATGELDAQGVGLLEALETMRSAPVNPVKAPEQLASPAASATVVDLSVSRSGDALAAKRFVEQRYPRLRLVLQHTSGTDLQHSRTHTFTARLCQRVQGGSIGDEESHALRDFFGEAIGSGYHSTLCRALQEAFRGVNQQFPPAQEAAGGVWSGQSEYPSVLGVYQAMLATNRVTMSTRLTATEVSIHAAAEDGSTLYVLSGEAKNALGLMLSAAEAVAEKVDGKAATEARNKIANAPLVLVLPSTGVRIKWTLRRLLNYTYGIHKEAVDFHVTSPSPSVFTCDVRVPLPGARVADAAAVAAARHNAVTTDDTGLGPQEWPDGTPTAPSKTESLCTLGTASSTNKKTAMRLAALQVMREHFPRIFADQIDYHPEIQSLLDAAPHAGSVCPHISRGLRVILEWAVAQENHRVEELSRGRHTSVAGHSTQKAHLSFLTQRLAPGQYHEETGQRASTQAWETILTIGGSALEAGSHTAYVLPLRVVAIDGKKARSEQKAFAAAIALRYRHMCAEVVSHGVQQGLVQTDGHPVLSAGMLSSGTAESAAANPTVALASADRLLRGLQPVPKQTLLLEPLERDPLLFQVRALGLAHVQRAHEGHGGGRPHLQEVVEQVLTPEGELSVVRLCTVVPEPTEDVGNGVGAASQDQGSAELTVPPVVLCEATHRYKICALVQAYKKLLNAPESEDASEAEQAPTPAVDLLSLFGGLPAALPSDKPLDTVCAALQALYGLEMDVHMYTDRWRTVVELWGRASGEATPAPVDEASSELLTPEPLQQENHFFLAKGNGGSPAAAALRCARNAFETHVRPHHGLFPGRHLRRLVTPFVTADQSVLGDLTGAVLTEISATNTADTGACSGSLRVDYDKGRKEEDAFRFVFSALSDNKAVELERVSGPSLPTAIRRLCDNISHETGIAAASELNAASHYTPTQQLHDAVSRQMGLTLLTDTVFTADETWHCRLSAPLGGSNHYCLAEAAASKKKEAVDAACQLALLAYFPQHATALGLTVVASDPSRPTGSSASTERNYIFTLH